MKPSVKTLSVLVLYTCQIILIIVLYVLYSLIRECSGSSETAERSLLPSVVSKVSTELQPNHVEILYTVFVTVNGEKKV